MYVCKYVCKISLVYKFNMAHVHYCFCCHVMIMFIYNEFFIFVATKQKKGIFYFIENNSLYKITLRCIALHFI